MANSRVRYSLGSTEDEVHIRITVFGGLGVGKSSIISRFINRRFSPDYKTTIEDLHRTHLDFEGSHVTLDILDTAGHGEFVAMRHLAISTSDAFLLVFSKVDQYSFKTVEQLRSDIISERGNVPIIIVENKSDIPSDDTETTESKILDAVVCLDWQSTFIQTSAKDDVNINLLFEKIIRLSNKNSKVKYPARLTRSRFASEGSPLEKLDKGKKSRCSVS